MVRAIALNHLPRLSPWPALLLGAKPTAVQPRTKEKILREYGTEKWGRVLRWLKTRSACTAADLYREQGLEPGKIIPFSHGQRLLAAPAAHVLATYEGLLLTALQRHRCDTLVELGCGLGEKLLKFAPRLRARVIHGGEFTASGVACGRILARRLRLTATFEHFDYTDASTLATVPQGALVYTSHSVEQIPRLPESFIQGLLRRSPRCVIHFEPCYEDHGESSLLGLMRRRYTEVNDYNRDLVGLLRWFEAKSRIRILEHKRGFFGVSPFNPSSLIVWCPF